MNNTKVAVFCDFDGTIARRDVGYSIFHHFSGGRNDELLPDWKAGRLSSRDCLLKEAQMSPLTKEKLYRYLNRFELDPGFPQFARKCQEAGIGLFILSDGLDLYIDYLLRREGLEHLPVIANHGYVEDNRLIIEFPHTNHNCTKCGSCKGERIREYRQSQEGELQIVFVGDGFSDACATTEADILFAKKDLEQHCRMNNIDFQLYDNFFDVSEYMDRTCLFVEHKL
ncbi:MAG: MtnX-like HAD-IB family phosphatase [candidate division Zixibacteria bacterium]|nr:MtnX-like HAD-IB family phosphatase [candidate division Zixibacteria bacterium]